MPFQIPPSRCKQGRGAEVIVEGHDWPHLPPHSSNHLFILRVSTFYLHLVTSAVHVTSLDVMHDINFRRVHSFSNCLLICQPKGEKILIQQSYEEN